MSQNAKNCSVKRFVLGIIFYFLMYSANATMYEVSLSGNHDFTSIQQAVDNASDNDTVLVHPGTYHENITIYDKSVCLVSTYSLSGDPEDIENTFISGLFNNSAIRVESSDNVTIQGFKISNNYLRITHVFPEVCGGGIFIDDSNAEIFNCSIVNCISRGGSGLMVGNNSDVFLSGLIIHNNHALFYGGGVCVEYSSIVFDDNYKCSVFGNYSAGGMDICLIECNEEQNFNVNLSLELVSNNMLIPDDYYIRSIRMNDVIVNAEESCMNYIETDLYVSPDGNDANSGITPDEPLKTIAYAMNIISPDSLNQRNIYVASGTYSFSENQQIFPFGFKSHIDVIGEENVQIDLEGDGLFGWIICAQNIGIMNIRIINGNMFGSNAPLVITYAENTLVSNVNISNCISSNCGLEIYHSTYIELTNVVIHNTESNACDLEAIFSRDSSIIMNNCVIDNIGTDNPDASYTGIYLSDCDIVMNNTIITNNYCADGKVFTYCSDEEHPENRCIINNSLIVNNSSGEERWWPGLMDISNTSNTITISNTTIANNFNNSQMLEVYGDLELNNNIFFNQGCPSEISFPGFSPIGNRTLNANNNCIDGGRFAIFSSGGNIVNYDASNIEFNPDFEGERDPDLTDDMSEYYRLGASSLCIDAGTPDTLGLGIPPTDLDGAARIWNGVIDIGCYEYNSVPNNDETQPQVTNQIKLYNYPNPVDIAHSNPYTFIDFQLPNKQTEVPEISIYNIKGQLVRTLKVGKSREEMIKNAGLEQSKSSNFYSVTWNCRDNTGNRVASGIYFYKLTIESESVVKKMMLVK